MNAYDFVHLSLLALGGRIRGKTKLQKMVYLLGIITGNLDELGYRPHFYGPYSADVADAVDRLKSLGFVDESVAGSGGFDQSGFEVARHDFRVNAVGRRIAEAKSHRYTAMWRRLTRAAELLRKAGEQDYEKLSIAAKAFFMLGEKQGKATSAELAELAPKFGWSVKPEQIQDAAQYLQRLGLVELSGAATTE